MERIYTVDFLWYEAKNEWNQMTSVSGVAFILVMENVLSDRPFILFCPSEDGFVLALLLPTLLQILFIGRITQVSNA